ncbi:S66 peptidase family protein [Runella slithyformis]|uniref:Peptidase U61 LD-carboxypeptidase A n=1 Tax=Runella slithyformis (strain ATCC 29530 / DSM 19594 / LMG 11500 / NCIMB 11436 / LSU 4) TaxID=761193 RepID=A0A7U4E8K0_RUNSL|nr:LD-carboxypeptidase [Runella slithyformis]AEI51791.1 peptidase U61 LD-carboxypeptidase A [Runella slithyformis DSM 19594]
MTRPPFLRAGDRVGVLALASQVSYDALYEGLRVLREDWHLEVVEGDTLHTSYHQFSGTDDERRADFQNMLDDPKMKAVFSARGGYGSSRIIDRLNFSRFKKAPKWVIGFSDITALHCHLHCMGVESLHATMPKLFGQEGGGQAVETLRKALWGEPLQYNIGAHPLNRVGTASGQVAGGNICLLAHLLGSRSALDTRGKLLFIEDVEETYYNLDRMMVQLKRARKLDRLAGLIVGQVSDMKDNETIKFGKTAYEIIAEYAAEHGYPVCFDFPVGHVADNRAMIVGREAQLTVTAEAVQLLFK